MAVVPGFAWRSGRTGPVTSTSLTIDAASSSSAQHAFDYSGLEAGQATAAKAARDRIRTRVANQIRAIIDTGDDLLQVKKLLGHGSFSSWIEAEFGMSQRTATNYMRAAEVFHGKTEIIADLPATTVYALASAPVATRDVIVEKIEAGALRSEQTVKDALFTARQEQKLAAATAKLSPRQRKSRAQREAEHAASREKHEREYQAAIAAAVAAASIVAEALSPEQAASVGNLLAKARHYLREPLERALLERSGQA